MAKVLVIEDDLAISGLYQRTLTLSGYEVILALDGEEGLAKARAELPDIILLDIVIPKINGLEVLRQLKADSNTQKIPVVVMTNSIKYKDEEVVSGAVKYIVKSDYEPRQISGMVADVLAGERV